MIMSWPTPMPSLSTPSTVTGKLSMVFPRETVIRGPRSPPARRVRCARRRGTSSSGQARRSLRGRRDGSERDEQQQQGQSTHGGTSELDHRPTDQTRCTGDASSAGRLGPAEPSAARRKYGDRVPNLQGDARFRPQLAAVQAIAPGARRPCRRARRAAGAAADRTGSTPGTRSRTVIARTTPSPPGWRPAPPLPARSA